ncbi:inhibitor of nuclear factor kappa-B kinase-interacting protein-like isoform X1 [Synchiropus splendidus]|uniref:inhibitor of nuclear factor kappa-B kinase-interacting protein-like isoform X1 n=1 Tax=Synchiropus splendidus TaxID=270530 RepID=UPI00237E4BB7|nr:inhibitor of nuclear factor kappa-B kinase-interacting protein-like isoform X1 [Synchiropus splendidus]
MPSDVKQRKKTPQQGELKKSSEEPSAEGEKSQVQKVSIETGNVDKTWLGDLKTFLCLASLAACAALSWMVLQQNERFGRIEEQHAALLGKTSALFAMEEQVLLLSRKLDASEPDLQRALSAASRSSRLQRDVAALSSVITVLQGEEASASEKLQRVNARFLNVTETWQERLAAAGSDLTQLKAWSRQAHTSATAQVNEAERRARLLEEKLQELEDSTQRNARALERTEEADARKAQEHLDWNTQQVHRLEQQLRTLALAEAQLQAQLQEHIPRAQECEEQLPRVEEAVRSILRMAADLSAAETRLEEATLQVLGTEDSMLKALAQILQLRQDVDSLQAHSAIGVMKKELSVVKEAVHELAVVLRESRAALEEEDWGGSSADPE